MQTFGMIVTAEPYAAVSQPGNTVILENVVVAAGEDITAKYELLGSGTYSSVNTHIQDAIFGIDPNTPRELFEARNAVRIAHLMAADKYAPTIIAKADEQLRQAETAYRGKQDKRTIEAAAREAAQTAEESRVMAVKQKAEEEAQAQAAADKKAADDRAAKARADAEAQARARAEADTARAQAEKRQGRSPAGCAGSRTPETGSRAGKSRSSRAAAGPRRRSRQSTPGRGPVRPGFASRQKKRSRTCAPACCSSSTPCSPPATRARGLIANMSDVLFKSGSSELAGGSARAAGQGFRNRARLSHPASSRSKDIPTASATDDYNQQLSEKRAERGSRVSGPAGNCFRFDRGHRLRQDLARRHKRHARRTPAESPRRTRALGRRDRRPESAPRARQLRPLAKSMTTGHAETETFGLHVPSASLWLRFFRLQCGMEAGFQCAGCGEWNETSVDESAGRNSELHRRLPDLLQAQPAANFVRPR